jgi:hypothetical protein
VFVADYEIVVAGYAGPRTVWIVGWDRRVPLVGPLCLSGDVQAAVDVADFENFVLQNDLLAIGLQPNLVILLSVFCNRPSS